MIGIYVYNKLETYTPKSTSGHVHHEMGEIYILPLLICIYLNICDGHVSHH